MRMSRVKGVGASKFGATKKTEKAQKRPVGGKQDAVACSTSRRASGQLARTARGFLTFYPDTR